MGKLLDAYRQVRVMGTTAERTLRSLFEPRPFPDPTTEVPTDDLRAALLVFQDVATWIRAHLEEKDEADWAASRPSPAGLRGENGGPAPAAAPGSEAGPGSG